ncbi:hypothetical protein KEM55_002225 [Ascosphaera atra]|nr:hypothetical protein KEM55_002225 [Ascosphaera atra]
MPNNRAVFLDKIEDYTQLKLQNGYYAYSSEYDPVTNNTNAFCAGGGFLADGRLLAVGGNAGLGWLDPTVGDGFKGIRLLRREFDGHSLDGNHWIEPGQKLDSERWYPTVQIMPNGHVLVVSGSLTGLDPMNPKNNNPTYEMLNADAKPYGGSIAMPILADNQPYYMYPYVHVLKDGNIFIFVSRSSELFDIRNGKTVKKYPDLNGDYRSYPNTGSSALMPLRAEDDWEPEVMVCGGGSYVDITSPTDNSCGRIKPLSNEPEWRLELMPNGRTMTEAQLLPDGTILWINGCNKGAQGFGVAKDPIYDAWIYDPEKPVRQRWFIAGTSRIARLYHSVAFLLLDGTVMVAGSNPVEMPVLRADPTNPALAYVTEFRVEVYTPPYLVGRKGRDRPSGLRISTKILKPGATNFTIQFITHGNAVNELKVALYYGGFVTHSLHMGSRLLFLRHQGFEAGSKGKQEVTATMPESGNVVPPGPYVVYAVVDGVPSEGQFVMIDLEEKYKRENGEENDGGDKTGHGNLGCGKSDDSQRGAERDYYRSKGGRKSRKSRKGKHGGRRRKTESACAKKVEGDIVHGKPGFMNSAAFKVSFSLV